MNKLFRELTEDEIRNEFINRVHDIIDYWDINLNSKSKRDKLEGVAFSILSLIDGCQIGHPRFILAPNPCPEDKEFWREEGASTYYPENYMNNINCDISGCLHELFYHIKDERDKKYMSGISPCLHSEHEKILLQNIKIINTEDK